MKRILAICVICFLFIFTLYAQYDTSQFTGLWVLQSVKFKHPVDLNKDGYRSSDAFWEYDECRKDQQMELLPDFNAKTYNGCSHNGCTNEIRLYKWNLKEELVKEVKYDMGKRVVDERRPTVLKLNDATGNDAQVFVVIGVDENILTLKGLVKTGKNTTEEAILIYRKRKK
ncbi:hypothetical protein A3860_03105 [Niastella vici]|uniref:Lipocalin-like domain-containing protein n=1 Tax=Niastella vici TaxID=1703345 RepID=A0A1V9G9Z5_9BACT|nr:hypothetical protein [Niastella vici]OQP67354.1 hypothetical protein A3860_03105 [Niastella vici]